MQAKNEHPVIKHKTDLCVIGGGIAGLCAAVSAARHGLKVVLVQDRPVLGGNASSEMRMWIRGASIYQPELKEGGILEELALANTYYNPSMDYPMWDAVLYNIVISEKNIELLLNCTCIDASSSGGRITEIGCWQLTTYQRHVISAEYFCDCSGDSVLAPLVGALYMRGREAKSEYNESYGLDKPDTQTMGNTCLIQARETQKPVKYVAPPFAERYDETAFNYRLHFGGKKFLNTNYWWLEFGGAGDAISDGDSVRARLLAAAYGAWDFIKNGGKYDADNWALDFVGFLPGKRESRRYMGDYVLNESDVAEGRIFEDEAAYGGWPMDIHDPLGFDSPNEPNVFRILPKPYSIPLRCLYSKNIKNLFVAGRNISATHIALASTRVMATCGIMGQAVGIACAVAKKYKTDNAGAVLHIGEIKQLLRLDDCYLLGTPVKYSQAARSAKCDKALNKDGIERKINGVNSCVSLKPAEHVDLTFAEPVGIRGIRVVFDSDIPRDEYPAEYEEEKQYPMRSHAFLDPRVLPMPSILPKAYKLLVKVGGAWREAASAD
ncbi:MAG: FAD-dependent oxidoreductase, partial [Clostridiales bacterium]|nr:FAD-dependent oxidoreductase [Clostridiales bacterium]